MVSYKALNTTAERIVADWGDGVADGEARQAGATVERLAADWGDGIWDTTISDRLGDGEVACRLPAWRITSYRNSCVVVIDAVAHAINRKFECIHNLDNNICVIKNKSYVWAVIPPADIVYSPRPDCILSAKCDVGSPLVGAECCQSTLQI